MTASAMDYSTPAAEPDSGALAGTETVVGVTAAGKKVGIVLSRLATLLFGKAATSTSIVSVAGGTTAKAQINLAVSAAAPTAPNDGDIWLESNTNTGLKVRINGVTKTVTVS